jgi:hypothetical protein
LGNELVGLTEESSALRVADDDPVDTEIFNLFSADLAGEGAILVSRDVLSSNRDGAVQHSLGGCNVDVDGGDNNFNLGLVEIHGVEDLSALLSDEVNGAVGLPVSTDDVFS